MNRLIASIAAAAIFAFAAALNVNGHGIGEDLHDWDLHEHELEHTELISGFDAIARELLQHGTYNFDAESLRMLQKSHDFYTAATLPTAVDEGRTHELTAAGDAILLRFLETSGFAIEAPVENGVLDLDWKKRYPLPREDGFVLLHVKAGTSGKRAGFTLEHNLETHQEHNDQLALPYLHDGESWILLRLLRPPLESCIVTFNLEDSKSGDHVLNGAITVISETTGTLDFVVRDEFGNPTPAMVELRSARTNHIYRPATAVEFSEQMDHIAGTPVRHHSRPDAGQGVPYIASIPGDSWGMYYCIDRPFHMALPIGTWTIKVWKGVEYTPTKRTFVVTKDKTTEVDLKMDRWIDMAAQGWFSGDDHIHSRLMSDDDAERLFKFMEATDLDLGNILIMGNNLRTFYPQRGFGPEFRVEQNGRFLVPGQEDPRYFNGHALGLNITSLVRDTSKYLYNDWVASTIHEQGGLYGFAHMIFGTFNIVRDMALLMPQDLGDFGEIHQSGILETQLYYDFLNLGYELAAGGGSDVPYSHMMGEVRIFCYTGNQTLDADEWFTALKNGNCFVTNGPILELTLDGKIPGEEIIVKKDKKLKARAVAKGPLGNFAPQKLELIWHGDVIATKESTDTNVTELSIEIDVPAGFGGWLAIRAYSYDGQAAHTTPVYVTRKGYRRWDVEKAPAVIDKCLAAIEGYRKELLHMQHLYDHGAIPANQIYGNQLVSMIPGGLERADKAEAYYHKLRQTLAKEIEKRERN
ncbi:CehA/McbA family metallohydrolase [Pelagicoccus mobilis]|uniref:CehA/McbA family metallohydrolase n=1 Tax=Pelagicoccus mobilis TaxID=415221 RepID=A0A934VR55_9BACT|nr:CehA/McbA family metallohydrolase [Pelagicoccus mobilis]MBK1877189.1 CehA/McbA family metallohydrolase [Pelagicoccus mobilis]